MKRRALILGASGLVGGYCLEALLNSKSYVKVVALVRSRMPVRHPKLEQHVVDFEHLEDDEEYLQADDVFCCLGLTIKKAGSKAAFYKVDFTYAYELGRKAMKRGAQRYFLISSVGADPHSPAYYLKVKGEVEAALSGLAFKSLTIFRPSLIAGPRKEFRRREKVALFLARLFGFLWVGPFARYRPIEAKAIGDAMVRVAESDATQGIKIFESNEIQAVADGRARP